MIFVSKSLFFCKRQFRKIPFIPFYLLKLKCKRRKRQKFFYSNVINVFSKDFKVIRPFLSYKFLVHYGKLKKVFIVSNLNIGFRFGEFFMTRRFGSGSVMHARKKKKVIKK